MKRRINRTLALSLGAAVLVGLASGADTFTGPDAWILVNTNAVKVWNAAQAAREGVKAWPGVSADAQRREVRLLAEAVGHPVGTTVEFLLIGPVSDRAYESAAVAVAKPGDIVRAVESIGVARGGCIGSRPFRFWPFGEHFSATVRRVDAPGAAERPLQSLVRDAQPDSPLIGEGGIVFTGGYWTEAGACWTDANAPSPVISLYNDAGTVFDLPFQVAQGAVYGRLTLAEKLPFGALLEVVFRPLPTKDGQPGVLPVTVSAAMDGDDVVATLKPDGPRVAGVDRAKLQDALAWLRAQSEQGRELFVTVGMDDAMPIRRAADVARVFSMLDGAGLKLDGKTDGGLYPKAFLPQESWRERAGRNPQPFEVHVVRNADGSLAKKMVFIDEDWSGPGLDPKLSPKEYPFADWKELPGLVEKAAGPDNKVTLLFVFAPADLPLSTFMPGVRAVEKRLPLVYVFAD